MTNEQMAEVIVEKLDALDGRASRVEMMRGMLRQIDYLERAMARELELAMAVQRRHAARQHTWFAWTGLVLSAISVAAAAQSTGLANIVLNGFGAIVWAGVALINFRGLSMLKREKVDASARPPTT